MKPSLIWCVWYRGKAAKGAWKLWDCTVTQIGAKALKAQAETAHARFTYVVWKITRHEVEAPK